MNGDLKSVWVYLTASPLLGLTTTLVAFQLATWIWNKAGRIHLLNPVVVAIFMLMALLMATGTDYATYFDGAQFVHFLLGPATVALAVPLYRQMQTLRSSAGAIAAAIIAGSVTAVSTAVLIAYWLGASRDTWLSLAPKSVTTPIAMGIAEAIGGLPSLTTMMVMFTGMIGVALGPWLLERIRVTDQRAQGLALGVASHGLGTARALMLGEVAGAFSGLAMGLNGLATAIVVPFLFRWILG